MLYLQSSRENYSWQDQWPHCPLLILLFLNHSLVLSGAVLHYTNWYFTADFLRTAYDDRQQVDSIYLDIRKAFDTVSHNKLLSKLWDAGIVGDIWSFFKAYLSHRQQCVLIEGQPSEWLPVSSGVPQGSIFGPLLFILFINDLPSVPSFSRSFLFADDTKCCARVLSLSDCSKVQEDLDLICNWSMECGLSFNASKSWLLWFPNRHSTIFDFTYSLNEVSIPSLSHCRDLGIVFSHDLSWSLHYNSISAKAYRQLGLIRRTFSPSISTNVKKLLYLSLVRSQVSYCSQVWRPHFIKDIKLLERIQRRATKYILNDYSSDYKSRLTALHLLPLMYFYELLDVLFFVRCLKFPDPSFQILDFVSFSSAPTRSASNAKLTHKSQVSLLHSSQLFCQAGAHLELPSPYRYLTVLYQYQSLS